jgi:hypothetical protein
MTQEQHIENYFKSIVEREVIFIRKELLKLPREQWTDVEVYQKYRFCNVHRCYDRTFKLIKRLSDLLGGIHPGLRTVLRWLASNPLLEWLIYNFDAPDLHDYIMQANEGAPEELFNKILKAYHNGVIPLVSGSFIVKRYGDDLQEMLDYYKAGDLFHDNIICKYTIADAKTTTQEAVQFFKDHAPWCADFGAYCIVSDWIYLMPEMFTDLYTWTAFGPGAYRGIQLLAGNISKKQYLSCLQVLREEWNRRAPEMYDDVLKQTGLTRDKLNELCSEYKYYSMEDLLLAPTMLDVEHWLCEYAKYARGWTKKKYWSC